MVITNICIALGYQVLSHMAPHLINSHNNPGKWVWVCSPVQTRQRASEEWDSFLLAPVGLRSEFVVDFAERKCEFWGCYTRTVRVYNLYQPGHPLASWAVLEGLSGSRAPYSWLSPCLNSSVTDFFLPGNEAKPGGLINPSRCWAGVTGSRRKPSSCWTPWGALAGKHEEMERSLQSANCSRANHLSEGNRKERHHWIQSQNNK